jgi:hypothetical protein
MTPKEKASDLVCNFYAIQSNEYDYGINWEMAKQCALIAVDEIINECGDRCLFSKCDYWNEVKTEIGNC